MIYAPYVAILVAFALIYLPRGIVSREMKKLDGRYNNNDVRGQQARLEGVGKRALGAHNNGFEAFAPFAVGVLAACQRGCSLMCVSAIAAVFVVARIGYIVAYLGDRASLRSALWTLGTLSTAALMVVAIVGPR